MVSVVNAIELGDLEDICDMGQILQVSNTRSHYKEWYCGAQPVITTGNYTFIGNINFTGNVTFTNITVLNITGISTINNSDFLDGYDSSYFYPYYNPLQFINFTNLSAYNTTVQLYSVFLNITDQRYNDTNLINRSFNQSLTDSLYYLKSNPMNYINKSNLTEYAKYQFANNNINGTGNFTTTSIGTFGGFTLPGSGGSWNVYVNQSDNSLNFVWS